MADKIAPSAAVADLHARLDRIRLPAWRKLLNQEKRRRGVDKDRLVFIGVHNVADIWWCAARAVRKARDRELGFFVACVQDRLAYSVELGRIRSLPKRMEDWPAVGDDLTLDDVNRLLASRRPPRRADDKPTVAQAKGDVLYLAPSLPADQQEWCADWARRMGWKVASADQDPELWSQIIEDQKAERYPTIRWHFPWEHYVVVGIPDGLTAEFAYEFKIARSDDVARRFVKPVATAQADLYACFFGRAHKRVQIAVMETEKDYLIAEPVDLARAVETLRTFSKVDAGEPARPPAAWKCAPGRCEYIELCETRRKT